MTEYKLKNTKKKKKQLHKKWSYKRTIAQPPGIKKAETGWNAIKSNQSFWHLPANFGN